MFVLLSFSFQWQKSSYDQLKGRKGLFCSWFQIFQSMLVDSIVSGHGGQRGRVMLISSWHGEQGDRERERKEGQGQD